MKYTAHQSQHASGVTFGSAALYTGASILAGIGLTLGALLVVGVARAIADDGSNESAKG